MGIVSLNRAVLYLAKAQHAAGSWTDFWLPVGTSDAWVTAYTGLALQEASVCPLVGNRARAEHSATVAADWLLEKGFAGRGWGYNRAVPRDADSTAHAVSLLARLKRRVPDEAIAFLYEHYTSGAGFSTYSFQDISHRWTRPCNDVTAASLRALYDSGSIGIDGLRKAWLDTLGGAQDQDGLWQGYWWLTPNYTTGLAMELWNIAGRPPLKMALNGQLSDSCAFDIAWAIICRIQMGDPENVHELVERLSRMQNEDGGWPAAPILKVPPSYDDPGIKKQDIIALDARRIFTTASALRALVLATGWAPAREVMDSLSAQSRANSMSAYRRKAGPIRYIRILPYDPNRADPSTGSSGMRPKH
jgi:hypothetical protein